MTELDLLLGFPTLKLTLSPEGIAQFNFPKKSEQNFTTIWPAKKEGDPFWDFCTKAPIKAELIFENGDKINQSCFDDPDEDPCSSRPCLIDISSHPDSTKVNITLSNDSEIDAAIWEIRLSQFEDYAKLKSIFGQEAQDAFDELAESTEFSSQLTFASIVGRRGTGKSTIASFLTGNCTMFEVKVFK